MLTLVCGQPRAGKTTYAKRFDKVIHLDECGYRKVEKHVRRAEGDVVVEGVYDKAMERKRLVKAHDGSGFKCIWLDTPDEVRRSRYGWDKFCDRDFEPPTYDEGWDEIVIIRSEDG